MLRLSIVKTVRQFLDAVRSGEHRLFAGIDLGLPRRSTTGLALLCCRCRTVWLAQTTPGEALSACLAARPHVVAIDAPLTMPVGALERDLERICRALGYKLIPPLLGPMRRLTKTGILLAEVLESAGVEVVETHPRSALKSAGVENPRELLKSIVGRYTLSSYLTEHMLDALVSSLVAISYYYGLHSEIQDRGKSRLILLSQTFIKLWLRRDS